jgi:hypothetical protein
MPLNLPHGSEIVAASAYTDYDMDGLLAGNGIIRLWAARKNNSMRPRNPCREYLISPTGGNYFPRHRQYLV